MVLLPQAKHTAGVKRTYTRTRRWQKHISYSICLTSKNVHTFTEMMIIESDICCDAKLNTNLNPSNVHLAILTHFDLPMIQFRFVSTRISICDIFCPNAMHQNKKNKTMPYVAFLFSFCRFEESCARSLTSSNIRVSTIEDV